MTRILALTNFYPPYSVGGDQSAADVLERLVARGHHVTVLTSDWRPTGEGQTVTVPVDRAPAPAADVQRELRLYWADHEVVVPSRRRRVAMEWHNRAALRRALATSRAEVVCVWTVGALSLGLLSQLQVTSLPLVYAVCNDWLVWGPDQDAWMAGWADRPRLGRVVAALTGLPTAVPDVGSDGAFLFVSDWTRRYAEAHSRWTFPDSGVVYSGIEVTEFSTEDRAGAEDRGGWDWRILYVGRLDPDKGVATAVRALAQLPERATLDLIGPGSEAQRADLVEAAVAAGVGSRVRFDHLARRDLARRYGRADVLVFPSRWEEPFGLTPIEAMACSTPVVSTCLGGSSEYLVDGVNCLCVPREDPTALAGAVARLAGDTGLRERLVAAGRRTAAELTTDRLADTFEAWLVAAASRYREGRPGPRSLPWTPQH